ncbi:MAG TPA: heme exporter protein CcmD [Candidatus Cybelea sp.]|nr:heme exporter protein CcmD [Candidatus Cybelea sp.]
METLGSFFAMGGYAAFVWPAFGVTAAVLIGLLLASLKSWRDNEAALRSLEDSQQTRRRRSERGNAP